MRVDVYAMHHLVYRVLSKIAPIAIERFKRLTWAPRILGGEI